MRRAFAGQMFISKGWTLKAHYRGERAVFEVSNYSEDPPFVHDFASAYDAAVFFLDIGVGNIQEIVVR